MAAYNMIIESLIVMVFGMLGIFLVMGLILLTIMLLSRFGGNSGKDTN